MGESETLLGREEPDTQDSRMHCVFDQTLRWGVETQKAEVRDRPREKQMRRHTLIPARRETSLHLQKKKKDG